MAMMEISIVPIGTGQTSLSGYVASLVKIVEGSGLDFELHDMGTVVQGEIDELFALAHEMHQALWVHEVKRVYTVIKIDDRRDKKSSLGQKVSSVRQKL